jgi:hypothetical protein
MNDKDIRNQLCEAAPKKPRFALGQVVATPGALEALKAADDDPATYLQKHVTGDWGDLPAEDKRENEFSVNRQLRLLSAYHLTNGTKIWIITEADRSATTLLLPSEY